MLATSKDADFQPSYRSVTQKQLRRQTAEIPNTTYLLLLKRLLIKTRVTYSTRKTVKETGAEEMQKPGKVAACIFSHKWMNPLQLNGFGNPQGYRLKEKS